MNWTGNGKGKEIIVFYLTKLLTDNIVLRRRKVMAEGWNDSDRGKPKYWGETSVSAALSNRDPSLGSNPASAMIGQRLTA